MIPSESLNSMGFGNLAMTVAYLENTKKAAKGKTQESGSSSSETAERISAKLRMGLAWEEYSSQILGIMPMSLIR